MKWSSTFFLFDRLPNLCAQYYRKIHCLTSEFHVKFDVKNRYCTNRKAMSAISVFQVNFSREFFLNRIAKATWAKPNIFYFILWAAPVRKQRKAFQSQSQCVFPYFWVWVISSNVLKFYWFQFEIWQTVVFYKFVHFQGIFFLVTRVAFLFSR